MMCWWVGSFAIATVAVIVVALKLNADAKPDTLDAYLKTRRLV